jgi:hypothetical protein
VQASGPMALGTAIPLLAFGFGDGRPRRGAAMPDDPQAARNDERSGAPLRLPPPNPKSDSKSRSKRASARGKAAKQRG